MNDKCKITAEVNLVLVAISNASNACARLRFAAMKVILPRVTLE